ncbi:Protein-arginine deiminase [Cordyceps fumosorosea ARSEF 2679]|uniref:Protein-arginine deiminase n=1 Tax=Cordyceps fumosorosea (strain ARSEF 2679) TaxID=1081104 RepID=A0A168DFN8_CORFA|nr:Protein-arginine deiminase [Cordyceps fumosorosea ARSEF 2679]OAA72555.1 Protein-arginine deiminase [Cordyceps fumosorosea ARSEF 2679]
MRLSLILGGLQLASAAAHGKCRPKGSTATNSTKLAVTILADTNRDGKVDVTGDTDIAGKETWTNEVGALFLANIVDTDRRCSSKITGRCASQLGAIFNETEPPEVPVLDTKLVDPPADPKEADKWLKSLEKDKQDMVRNFGVSGGGEYMKINEVDRKISACHDASDNILRNATYLAPLRTRPIPGLSDSATGTVSVTRSVAASKVRLFHKPSADGKWEFVAANHTFTAAELKAGLELGIDGRDVRRPGGWDGKATVEFKVTDKGQEVRDSVALRVAPVLTQHHGQAAKQLVTGQLDSAGYKSEDGKTDIPPSRDAAQKQFVEDFGKAGASVSLHTFEGCDERWVQDIFEPGYMSIPGPDGGRPVGLHVMIRSAQQHRAAGRMVFSELRSGTVGAVQHLADGDTTDSTGNLETVPPHQGAGGKSFSAGRAVLGSQDGTKPHMFAFLEAQEAQAPIELDTTWLSVGHTDEFVQFLPSKSAKLGWVMVVSDPRQGVEILKKAQAAGHGKEKATSRKRSPADPARWNITTTIDDLLGQRLFEKDQNTTAGYIDRNVEILKRETGLTDEDIIRLPGMYTLDEGYLGVVDPWVYQETKGAEDAGAVEEKPDDAGTTEEDAGKAGASGEKEDKTNDAAQITRRRDEDRKTGGGLSILDAGTPPGERKAKAAAMAATNPHGAAEAPRRLRRRQDDSGRTGGGLSVLDAGTPPSQRKAKAAAMAAAKPHGGRAERRQEEIYKVGALYPATVNSVVVDDKTIIAPNPWGPVIDGKDVMAAATEEAYAKAGYTVRYVDEWFTHHNNGGEVHCGTNVIRHLTDDKWW